LKIIKIPCAVHETAHVCGKLAGDWPQFSEISVKVNASTNLTSLNYVSSSSRELRRLHFAAP